MAAEHDFSHIKLMDAGLKNRYGRPSPKKTFTNLDFQEPIKGLPMSPGRDGKDRVNLRAIANDLKQCMIEQHGERYYK